MPRQSAATLNIRLTQGQKESIVRRADEQGLSIAQYVLRATCDHIFKKLDDVDQRQTGMTHVCTICKLLRNTHEEGTNG